MNLLNLGHAYYRDYYTTVSDKDGVFKRRLRRRREINLVKPEVGNDFTEQVKWVSPELTQYLQPAFEDFHERMLRGATHVIEGTVASEGWLSGIGYEHQKWVGLPDASNINDHQMGLDFDIASGVPILRGSGLKGGLRAWFDPMSKDEDFKTERKNLLRYVAAALDCKEIASKAWSRYLFEGGTPFGKTQHDRIATPFTPSYLGMAPMHPGRDKALFQLKNLAPQDGPTVEPKVLSFLTVRPGTRMRAYFSFPDPQNDKRNSSQGYSQGPYEKQLEATIKAFAYYMKEYGLGAKNRYGHGRIRNIQVGAARLF